MYFNSHLFAMKANYFCALEYSPDAVKHCQDLMSGIALAERCRRRGGKMATQSCKMADMRQPTQKDLRQQKILSGKTW